jgi:hypothetical protein
VLANGAWGFMAALANRVASPFWHRMAWLFSPLDVSDSKTHVFPVTALYTAPPWPITLHDLSARAAGVYSEVFRQSPPREDHEIVE